MKMIILKELSPEERQAWVGRMLMAEELGQVFDYEIPPMPTPNTKPMPAVEVHISRKKSYAGFKLYLVFVALCIAYVVLS